MLVGQEDASYCLLDSVSQVIPVTSGTRNQETDTLLRRVRARIFENACSLAASVPVYRLRLSLTGRFWENIEEVLHST